MLMWPLFYGFESLTLAKKMGEMVDANGKAAHGELDYELRWLLLEKFPLPSAEAMGVHDPVLGKYVEKMVTPHPFATYDTKLKLKNPIGNGLPATYITCVDPVYPPLSASR
jgi:hypothetical protein